MKKIHIFIFLFMLCFFLTACDPASYSFDKEELLNNVANIELINYDNPEQKRFLSWVPDHSSELLPFNSSNMTILESLNNEEVSIFIEQLSEISFLYKYYAFDSPKGICIRINYVNGDFMIISCNYENQSFAGYIGNYSSNGDVISFVGSFTSFYDFKDLVNNFFDTKLNYE